MSRLTPTGRPKVGLVQFPGSNCDVDLIDAMQRHFQIKVEPIWHTEAQLPQVDAVLLPGGFSYGDYLKSGALAAHSPIMAAVKSFVQRGGAVMGVCNGFQVLTESRLLPGALLRNQSRQFVCRFVDLRAVEGPSAYQTVTKGKTLKVPVAHGEGRYYNTADGLKRLKDNGQVVFRYVDNPNGAVEDIAGIVSENGRVFGMMPHPERATDELMGGSKDGLTILEAFLASFS